MLAHAALSILQKQPLSIWKILHFALCLGFRVCETATRFLPIGAVFQLGKIAGDCAYFLLWKRRALALTNLTLAFGSEKNARERRALNREHFRTLGANLLCCLKLGTMRREQILQRVTLEKPPSLQVPPERERSGWVAMISHLGNWELYSHLTALLPEYRFGAIYQRLANPFIDRHLRETRARAGVTLFDRREGYLRSVNFLRAGGVLGILLDQSAGYAGVWMPFFRRLASCSTLPATLAVRTGAPILPIAIYTCGLARWRIVVSEPIFPKSDEVEMLTTRINRELETQITRSPADWLWAHHRWKPLRPHFLFAHDQRRVFFPSGFDEKTLEPFRILIRSPESRELAEASLPAIRAIKNGRADAWIAVLAQQHLTGFWQKVPQISRVIALDENDSVFSKTAKIRRAENRFNAALDFSNSTRAGLEFFLTRIPIRAGLRRKWNTVFFNQYLEFDKADDPVQRFLKMAQSIGADINHP